MRKLVNIICMLIAKSDILSHWFYNKRFGKTMFKIHSWSCEKDIQQYQNDLLNIIDYWYGG